MQPFRPLLAAPDDVMRVVAQLVFLLFFIGIPILRTVLEKRAKSTGQGKGRDRARRPRTGPAREPKRDPWRELLEGMGAPPESRPEPAREAAPPEPAPELAAPDEPPARPESVFAELPAAPPLPAGAPPIAASPVHDHPEPTLAELEIALPSSSLGRDLPSAGADVGTGVGAGVGAGALGELVLSGIGDADAGRSRRRARAAPGPDTDWRRAFVLTEVLGPPVGLRGDLEGGGLGAPPGLR